MKDTLSFGTLRWIYSCTNVSGMRCLHVYVMCVCMFRGLGYVCVLIQLIFILNKITTDVFFEISCTHK